MLSLLSDWLLIIALLHEVSELLINLHAVRCLEGSCSLFKFRTEAKEALDILILIHLGTKGVCSVSLSFDFFEVKKLSILVEYVSEWIIDSQLSHSLAEKVVLVLVHINGHLP